MFLKNVISEFPEKIAGKAATLACDDLFWIRDKKETKPQKEEVSLVFHHTLAQLLFVATRTRRDIQMVMALCTTQQVKNSDEDNLVLLKRILKYLNGMRYLKLKRSVEYLGLLK